MLIRLLFLTMNARFPYLQIRYLINRLREIDLFAL